MKTEILDKYLDEAQKLIDAIQIKEDWIKANVPTHLYQRFNLGIFKSSQSSDYYFKVDGKFIPSKAHQLGQSIYWHNDFNCEYEAVNLGELRDFAADLPVIIEEAMAEIEGLTEELKACREKIS